jgi:hypothetical protein
MIRKPENSQSRKLDFDGSELSAWLFMAVLKHNSLLEEGCYRPIKIRIPASSARIPMTLFGITKRTINGSPCKINQTASNIIPTDMLSLLFLNGRDKIPRLVPDVPPLRFVPAVPVVQIFQRRVKRL